MKVLKSRKGNNIIAMLILITLVALLIRAIFPDFYKVFTDFDGLAKNNFRYYSFIEEESESEGP